MAKEIHILLSRKSFEELKDMEDDLGLRLNTKRMSYEEYLQKEKEKPTMALFG